jgi:hypothetical protein
MRRRSDRARRFVSQFVLDDQLSPRTVQTPICRWSTAQFVREIRPNDVIKDERVLVLLRSQRMPTFVTIDSDFDSRAYRDRHYCILFFAFTAEEQHDLPALLRRVLRLPEFRTRAARMGKVARVSRDHIAW